MAPITHNRKLDGDEALQLWRAWRASGEGSLRDRLVLTYAPLVKFIVYRRLRSMPAHAEVDDFLSVGIEALMKALERFDPTHGTTLEQFAWSRIHGAVVDEQRRHDWAPRSVRRRERELAKAENEFLALYGRPPRPEELAAAMDIDVSELRAIRANVARADIGSLNSPTAGEDGSEIEIGDTVASDVAIDPLAAATRSDNGARVRRALLRLTPREREVAWLVYAGDMTLAQVAARFGVTESRVCQIHTAMKRKLRDELKDEAAELLLAA